MVSTTRSRKANSASVNPTAPKNKPAEEEPQVLFTSVKITQDDELVFENVTEFDEDSKKINEHYRKTVTQQLTQDKEIAVAIAANPTSFPESTDEVFARSVNQQHYLANPHLPNPNTTKAEHVAKLREMNDKEATDDPVEAKVTLPPKGSGTPVPKPSIAPSPERKKPAGTPTIDENDPMVQSFKTKLDAWKFHHHLPSEVINTDGRICPIADALMELTISEQEEKCNEFFAFISQRITDVAILNTENTPYTFLVHIPGTRRLKVCYGIGSGISFGGIKGSSINDKALALSGDYNPGVKYPAILTFPLDNIAIPTTVKSPTYNCLFNLNNTLSSSNAKTTFFKANELSETVKLHHLAPIPAYLVHDYIDHSIDVFTVIDRLQNIQQQHLDFANTNCKLVYKHALNYCVNALVNRNKKDITVTFPIKHFMGDIDEDADTWKQQRLQQLFPQIFMAEPASVPSPSAPTPTITQATADPREDETTRLLKAYLASQLQQQTVKKEDTTEKCLGMCESEFESLLTYAGITNKDAGELPRLWHKLAEKNISKVGKANVARNALRNTPITYREAKIKVTPSLLTMITTRAFDGDLSSSKQEATKGLTPFALP
jgi:hypothetical protein